MTLAYLDRPKMALTIIGLWFLPENYKILYFLYRSVQLSVQYSFLLFNIIYMVMVWGDLEEVTEASYLLFTQFTLCLKATTFLANKNKLIRLLEYMESDVFATKSDIHKR